jgi:hypothetical protein
MYCFDVESMETQMIISCITPQMHCLIPYQGRLICSCFGSIPPDCIVILKKTLWVKWKSNGSSEEITYIHTHYGMVDICCSMKGHYKVYIFLFILFVARLLQRHIISKARNYSSPIFETHLQMLCMFGNQ